MQKESPADAARPPLHPCRAPREACTVATATKSRFRITPGTTGAGEPIPGGFRLVRVSPSSRPMAAACGAQGSGSCSPCGGGPAGSPQRRRYDGAALAGAERARPESAATCAAVPPPVPRPSATAGWPAPGGAAGGPRAPESVELAGVAPEEDGLGQGPQPRPAAGRPESGSRRGSRGPRG